MNANLPEITKLWGIPGAGKTTELIRLINEDTSSGKYKPQDFAVCAYGKRIAKEWKDLLGWSGEDDSNEPNSNTGTVKTIHGMCKSLTGINKVITEKQKVEFCNEFKLEYKPNTNKNYEVVDEFGLPVLKTTHHLGNLFFDANSFLKNNMYSSDQIKKYQGYQNINDKVPFAQEWIKSKQEQYTQWKQNIGVSDFDDMLTSTYEMEASPSSNILVVDEFQDITPIMNAIICEYWIPSMEKVYIAGDPRQTIFSFRGASSRFFEELPSTLVSLPRSYRLPDNIWTFAKKIIERTGQTVPNIIKSGRAGNLKKISESTYYEMIKNREFVSDTFHLVRTNHQGQKIAYGLMEAGIPFSGIMGWDEELKALYSLFLKIRKPNQESQVFREPEITALLNAYPADMFRKSNQKIWKDLDQLTQPYMFSQIRNISRKDIFDEPELWKLIRSNDPLSEAEPQYRNAGSRRSKLINALHKGGQLPKEDVVVSTIHGVKGSERSTVFLHDRTRKDTEFESIYNRTSSYAQSEACVFYVGATRSRKSLYIVNNDCKYHYPFPSMEGL